MSMMVTPKSTFRDRLAANPALTEGSFPPLVAQLRRSKPLKTSDFSSGAVELGEPVAEPTY